MGWTLKFIASPVTVPAASKDLNDKAVDKSLRAKFSESSEISLVGDDIAS